ncbi:hypothetical protein THAOC_11008 [Thalassiosira oceanica]|uniref:Uncharacterized protein n=1 Tax=Thalassiosira oceanica TaxID=159749 RepID=K0SSB4_THAOC|nr:hypothetical protein THAOC_11008 [Thalassiosira oceanica]|eukprot:EJK67889.1 hypothetical protein THAOC_11008 [Thalassiosira oceanica]
MSDRRAARAGVYDGGGPPCAEDEADRPDQEGTAVVSDGDGSDADFDEIARPWKDGTWDVPPGRQRSGGQRSRRQGSDADTDSEWGRDTDSEWDVDGTDESGYGGGGTTTGDADVFVATPRGEAAGGTW